MISTTTNNLRLVPNPQRAYAADDSCNGVDGDVTRIRRGAWRCGSGGWQGQQARPLACLALRTGLVNATRDGPGHQQGHEYLRVHSNTPSQIAFPSFAAASHRGAAEYIEVWNSAGLKERFYFGCCIQDTTYRSLLSEGPGVLRNAHETTRGAGSRYAPLRVGGSLVALGSPAGRSHARRRITGEPGSLARHLLRLRHK